MRTFIAIELPPEAKAHVEATAARLQEQLAAQGVGACLRFTPAANLHLTLRFLGETSKGQQQQIAAALGLIAATAPAFTLALGRVGAFPTLRRPTIVWLDLGGELATLAAIQGAVEAAVQAAGFAAESRGFTPHLTIARAQKSASPPLLASVGEILHAERDRGAAASVPGPCAFAVKAVHLIHSDLRPTGPIYTPLASFTLG